MIRKLFVILFVYEVILLAGCKGKKSDTDELSDSYDNQQYPADSIAIDSLAGGIGQLDSANVDLADTAQYHTRFMNVQSPERIAPGLWYMEIMPDSLSSLTTTFPLVVLKILPGYYRFELVLGKREDSLNVEAGETFLRTVSQWSEIKGFTAAINAGMFDSSALPQAYLLYNKEVLRPEMPSSHKHFFGISKNGYGHIYDAQCGPLPDSVDHCISLIRIQDCTRRLVWGKNPAQQWSLACLAQDDEGCIYFVHSRSAFMVNTVAQILRKRFNNLLTISYLDGGPESSLTVNTRDFKQSFFGSYETGYWEHDDRAEETAIPNVIGIRRR